MTVPHRLSIRLASVKYHTLIQGCNHIPTCLYSQHVKAENLICYRLLVLHYPKCRIRPVRSPAIAAPILRLGLLASSIRFPTPLPPRIRNVKNGLHMSRALAAVFLQASLNDILRLTVFTPDPSRVPSPRASSQIWI